MAVWQRIRSLFDGLRSDAADESFDTIQQIIGYHFRDVTLLRLGLTHRSHARINNADGPSNERLEFLGDSVLGLVIAARLYEDYPDEGEGFLTKTKALLVNETTLAAIGKQIGLARHVRLSPDEMKAGGGERASIISDAFEAIIGAVFLDGGMEPASDVVLRLIYTHRDRVVADSSQRNYKGELLELVQAQGGSAPRYDIASEEGPDHEKIFHVIVLIAGLNVGEGTGSSKKEAERRAACMALERIASRAVIL